MTNGMLILILLITLEVSTNFIQIKLQLCLKFSINLYVKA